MMSHLLLGKYHCTNFIQFLFPCHSSFFVEDLGCLYTLFTAYSHPTSRTSQTRVRFKASDVSFCVAFLNCQEERIIFQLP